MPTTSVRRPISRLKRSSGFGRAELAPVLGREAVEGEDRLLGLLEDGGDLRQRPLELRDRRGQPRARFGAIGLVEDRPDQGGQQPVLVAARMAEAIAQEVDRAALPGTRERAGDRRLEALVGVRDDQLDAMQPARDKRPQELAPERLGLGLTDVEPDDLAAA